VPAAWWCHVDPSLATNLEHSMAQRALPAVRTADDLQWLPDDSNRYEIIDGVLYVTSAPTLNHQRMVGALYRVIYPYATSLGLELFMAPVDVRASPVTQVEPDLLVAPRAVTHTVQTRWLPMPELILAIEVLSPSTARVDRGRKRELYLSERVDHYWIFDVDARSVSVWVPDAVECLTLTSADELCWQPVASADPLVIDLGALFAELL
jgi:Uma2 family endonuclease